jgi:hypothetical protein
MFYVTQEEKTNLKIYIFISVSKTPGCELENFGEIPGRARIFSFASTLSVA